MIFKTLSPVCIYIVVLLVSYIRCWSGITSCVISIANRTLITENISQDNPILTAQNYTFQTFEAVCREKEDFIQCVDKSLNSPQPDFMSLFKPLFHVETVKEAYTGLYNNLTGMRDVSHFSCLTNTTALMPCYAQFNSYFEYLSVFIRLQSGQGKTEIDSDTRAFLCTLTQRRIECEVGVLKRCSEELGEIMGNFYERSLPSVCKENINEGKVSS